MEPPGPAADSGVADEYVESAESLTGQRDQSQSFRLLIALEALGVGRIAGGTMNICGKLSAVPLPDPPNDEILEIGTLYGMFGAALIRMMERAGRDPSHRAGCRRQDSPRIAHRRPRRPPAGRGPPRQPDRHRPAPGRSQEHGRSRGRIQQGFSEDAEVRALVCERGRGSRSIFGLSGHLEMAYVGK
ncbi:hypothetical protein [Streptomyces sp. GESEQ-35]|uniref:hypothetical protein n=1 Tax=Streptomyces sp. GESEQ-35 TaxID=2812657 RepID=UPI001B329AEE|nr:hypothetical protein [Streptomyces sp. GESEQ-35]